MTLPGPSSLEPRPVPAAGSPAFLELVPEPVVVHDGETIRHANRAAARLLAGGAVEHLVGADVSALFPDDEWEWAGGGVPGVGRAGSSGPGRFRVRDTEGTVVAVGAEWTVGIWGGERAWFVVLTDSRTTPGPCPAQPPGRLGRATGDRIDPLTGLPGRALLLRRLEDLVDERTGAIVVFDLDRFRLVNAERGQAGGDALLSSVGQLLATELREGDLVARIGPNRFAVVLLVPSCTHAARIAERTRRAITELAGPGRLPSSAGVAFRADRPLDPSCLEQAEQALRRAKQAGGNRTEVSTPAQEVSDGREQRLIAELPAAIRSGQLVLHFQPIVDLVDGRVVGLEALVRWQHPELGLLPPGEFVPLAEHSGSIEALGAWVLRRACSELAARSEAGSIGLSVNLSPVQLVDPGLTGLVEAALADSGLAADRLTLEITETALAAAEDAIAAVTRLRRLGVGVAIDDFGTGYANLQYLKRLPATSLKLDRSFVAGVGDDPSDTAIARNVIGLARTLGLEVVAEGVETEAQHRFLRTLGASLGQGYYWRRPAPLDDLVDLLAPQVDGTDADERARLIQLWGYDVLDTEPEEPFDAVVELARTICGTPMALISLVDEDRQWFKARAGLDVTETPRSWSFCSHAIARPDEVLVVEDAAADDRFATNPLVVGPPGIRFYAGAAIFGRYGLPLGTVCVIGDAPRPIDPHQLEALRQLARIAGELLEQRRHLRDLAEQGRARARAEQEVRDAERWATTLVERSSDVLFVLDGTGCVTYVSPALCPVLGWDPVEVLGRAALDLVHRSDRDAMAAVLADVLAVPGPHGRIDLRIERPDGTPQWVEVACDNHLDDPVIAGVVLRVRDQSERMASRQFVQQLLDAIPHAIYWKDDTGHVVDGNSAARRMFGLRMGRRSFRAIDELLPDDARARTRELDRQILTGEEERLDDELVLARPEGPVHLQRTRVPLRTDGAITGVLCVSADVTTMRHLEERLEAARRLEAVGQLAAGVAHEINTPMQYIGDNLSFLAKALDRALHLVEVASGELAGAGRDRFQEACGRARLPQLRQRAPRAASQAQDGVATVARIVAAMKAFAHPGTGETTLTDLATVVDQALTVSRNEWKYVASIDLDLADDVPLVPLVTGELNQVLLNLIVNAAHAIADRFGADASPDTGRIAVSLRREETAGSVRLSISDNGCGIPPHLLAKVFEPFFTTKEPGKGTGQGLAIARHSVARHGGTLKVSSEEGVGTRFDISLPSDGTGPPEAER